MGRRSNFDGETWSALGELLIPADLVIFSPLFPVVHTKTRDVKVRNRPYSCTCDSKEASSEHAVWCTATRRTGTRSLQGSLKDTLSWPKGSSQDGFKQLTFQ